MSFVDEYAVTTAFSVCDIHKAMVEGQQVSAYAAKHTERLSAR